MKPRILFVDDDPNILTSFRSLLRKEFKIDTADHPEKGLALFKENGPYPVVVSDLKMPDMNGLEFLVEIEKLDEDVIGIILTGHADIKAALTALNQGHVFRFLTKPAERDTITSVINAGLEQHKLITGNKHKARIIKEDLAAAAFIQKSFLPQETCTMGNVCLNWLFKPSGDVGGDMFNLVPLDTDKTSFYLLDISGHGVSAALAAISVSRLLSRSDHFTAQQNKVIPPSELLKQLDADFPIERMNKHFTMFYSVISKSKKTLTYSSAGHLPPLLLRKDGSIEHLDKGGSVIGINAGIPFEQDTVPFHPGDRLISYTDGLSEYESPSGEQFGSPRLESCVLDHNKKTSKQLLDGVYNEMLAFGDNRPLQDDVTICCLEFTGEQS
ncbi:SpoIIE family protein phosphatase [Desulfovibrio sp. JC022]|uniref:SpoIIE family protein phosphatase n=1 Tax=Desulfovibrio sp. JC022 TaxID=2593642 RepID=UPI0013D63DA0|nr:SpoIIE family protein phosphatase [Desulfovibrio sp. JC022]NDV24287.1 SpoIIE family protein phosphatase [Desulfovibrio sp. JC022]